MNKNGNPGSLVAAHPGNTNAVKFGVHSAQAIAPRAAEIAAQLDENFEFSITQRIAVSEVARLIAILEAIDRDIEERGVIDKRGEPRSMLNHRSRIVRQLDHWLTKIAPVIERDPAEEAQPHLHTRKELVHELERIAFGRATTASPRDRVLALKELLRGDFVSREITTVQMHIYNDSDGNFHILPGPPDGPRDDEITDA